MKSVCLRKNFLEVNLCLGRSRDALSHPTECSSLSFSDEFQIQRLQVQGSSGSWLSSTGPGSESLPAPLAVRHTETTQQGRPRGLTAVVTARMPGVVG